MPRNSEFGASSVTTTVLASGVSMLTTGSMKNDAPLLRLCRRSHDHLTSLASTGEPSANTASGWRWKVNWRLIVVDVPGFGEPGHQRAVVGREPDQRLVDRAQIDLAGVAPGARRIERIDVHVARDHHACRPRRRGRISPQARSRRSPQRRAPAVGWLALLSWFLSSHFGQALRRRRPRNSAARGQRRCRPHPACSARTGRRAARPARTRPRCRAA